MIVPDVSNPFFGPIVRGAEQAARKAGYRLLLCNSESDLRLEKDYVADLVAHRVEGLLIAPVGDRSKGISGGWCSKGFPIVLLDRHVEGLACDSVTLDNEESARLLVSHLIDVGHRRIAFVTDADDVSTGRERLARLQEPHSRRRASRSTTTSFFTRALTSSAAFAPRNRSWGWPSAHPRSSRSTT